MNTHATTAYLLSYYKADFTDSATMSLAAGETVLIPKALGDKLHANNTAIKLTKVTYPKG